MENVNKNLVYQEKTVIPFSVKRLGLQICFFMGRHIKYGLIHAFEFLAKIPVAKTFAYCKLLELNQRVDTAYLRVLNDVKEEVKPNVTQFYKDLKSKISLLQLELYSVEKSNLETIIQETNTLCNNNKNLRNIIVKTGNQVIASYMHNYDKGLKEEKEFIDKIFSTLKEKNPYLDKNNWIEQCKALHLCLDLKKTQLEKIQDLSGKALIATHPDEAYLLREDLKNLKKQRQNFIEPLKVVLSEEKSVETTEQFNFNVKNVTKFTNNNQENCDPNVHLPTDKKTQIKLAFFPFDIKNL